MSTLDAIQARAEAAQGAWEEFQQGIATTRFALEEANNSAEDVPRLVAALRRMEQLAHRYRVLGLGHISERIEAELRKGLA